MFDSSWLQTIFCALCNSQQLHLNCSFTNNHCMTLALFIHHKLVACSFYSIATSFNLCGRLVGNIID